MSKPLCGNPVHTGRLTRGKIHSAACQVLDQNRPKRLRGAGRLFIVLLGWLSKIDLTTAEVLRSDVVRENVVVDVVAVVAPHVVREDVGGDEGISGGGVGHEVGTTSDGNTAVERGLGIGVEHLGSSQCNG